MNAKVLREWLADVLPIRAGALRVQLGDDDDVEVTASGELATTVGLAVLGADDAVVSYTEGRLWFAHREDLDLPGRTKSFLRAWAKYVARNHDACDVEGALTLTPVDVSPNRGLLENLAWENEADFLAAFGDRRHWDSSPDVTPPPLDIADLRGTEPIARSPDHERAIEESGFDREAFVAYARWLDERADPRGAAGVFEAEGTRMGQRRAARVLTAHERYFHGPLPTNDWDPHVLGGVVEVGLQMGWIDWVLVRLGEEGEKLDTILPALFRLPGARFLRELELSSAEYAYTDEAVEDVMAPLLAAGGHPALRSLILPCEAFAEEPRIEDLVTTLRRSFPRLASVTLRNAEGDEQ